MKKLVRAAMLTIVMFVGANAQAVREAESTQDQQTIAYAGPGECYWINGQWICDN